MGRGEVEIERFLRLPLLEDLEGSPFAEIAREDVLDATLLLGRLGHHVDRGNHRLALVCRIDPNRSRDDDQVRSPRLIVWQCGRLAVWSSAPGPGGQNITID